MTYSHGRGVALDVRYGLGEPNPLATFSFRADHYVIAANAVLADLSGNGLNAAQATAANQPSWSANGFGTESRAYALFDGVNDYLEIPDNALLEPGGGSVLYIAAVRMVSGAGFRAVYAKGSDAANSGQRLFVEGGGALHTYANGATNYAAAGFGLVNGTDSIAVWAVDSASNQSVYATHLIGPTRAAIAITAATNTANPFRLGRDNTASGYEVNMRYAGGEFFNLGAGVPINDAWVASLIKNYRMYYGI